MKDHTYRRMRLKCLVHIPTSVDYMDLRRASDEPYAWLVWKYVWGEGPCDNSLFPVEMMSISDVISDGVNKVLTGLTAI